MDIILAFCVINLIDSFITYITNEKKDIIRRLKVFTILFELAIIDTCLFQLALLEKCDYDFLDESLLPAEYMCRYSVPYMKEIPPMVLKLFYIHLIIAVAKSGIDTNLCKLSLCAVVIGGVGSIIRVLHYTCCVVSPSWWTDPWLFVLDLFGQRPLTPLCATLEQMPTPLTLQIPI